MKNTAVLFIHGFMGHSSEFNVLKAIFDSLNYDTFEFVLSGHDGGRIKNVTKEDWVNDCVYNVDKLINQKYSKIILVGHSMGGVLATIMAKKYGEYISRLILIAPAFEYLRMKDGKLDIIQSLKHFANIIHDNKNKKNYAKIFRCSIASIKEFRSLVREHQSDIYDIKCPILFINGDKDFVVPIEQSKNIYEKLTNKEKNFITVQNGSHWFLSSPLDSGTYNKIKHFLVDSKKRKAK